MIVRGSPIANVAEMLGRTGRCANVRCIDLEHTLVDGCDPKIEVS